MQCWRLWPTRLSLRAMSSDVPCLPRGAKTRPTCKRALTMDGGRHESTGEDALWTPVPCGMLDSDAGTTTEHAEVLPTVACGEDTLLPPPLPGTLTAEALPGINQLLEGQPVRVEERGSIGGLGYYRRLWGNLSNPF